MKPPTARQGTSQLGTVVNVGRYASGSPDCIRGSHFLPISVSDACPEPRDERNEHADLKRADNVLTYCLLTIPMAEVDATIAGILLDKNVSPRLLTAM